MTDSMRERSKKRLKEKNQEGYYPFHARVRRRVLNIPHKKQNHERKLGEIM